MHKAAMLGGGIGILAGLMQPFSKVSIANAAPQPNTLTPHQVVLADGKAFTLSLPKDFQIRIAAQGLKRVRFMAKSPDDRLFVTDMFNLTDNRNGAIYILDRFDPKTGKFGQITPYFKNLRNPNSIAFYAEPNGTKWLYVALTDRLIRYHYADGDTAPHSAPQVLAKFPDYGLSYKYGGWHLTRTIAIADQKLYVSVGSSCNSCEEKEPIRASIVEMDLDGKNQKPFATGLRNAVGLKWINDRLFATNMGADHLGDDQPEDTFYRLSANQNYGFPYCFEYRGQRYVDPQYQKSANRINCGTIPLAYTAFAAHSAPLGFEYFDATHSATLQNSFLVALHGGSKRSLQRGYSVMQLHLGEVPTPFITGFLQNGTIYGRPVDILRVGANAFFLTDDHRGVIYYVFKPNAN